MITQSSKRRALVRVVNFAERAILKRIEDRLDSTSLLVWFTITFPTGCALLAARKESTLLFALGWVVLALGAIVPLIAHGTEWFVNRIREPHLIGNRSFPVELYWKICEVLEQRGINDVQKYFDEHPAHNQALINLIYGDSPRVILKEWTGIAALIYLTEDDPEGTRATLSSLIEERGDMSALEYRALLEIRGETSSALTGGTL